MEIGHRFPDRPAITVAGSQPRTKKAKSRCRCGMTAEKLGNIVEEHVERASWLKHCPSGAKSKHQIQQNRLLASEVGPR